MITLDDYFGVYANHPEIDDEMVARARTLLAAVNPLLDQATAEGVPARINPHTGTRISGQRNGGWRPGNCPIGAPDSSHKQAMGIDVYDPVNELDRWLNDDLLKDAGLYREAPASTEAWAHLTTRAPGSGHRTFLP